LHDFVHEHAGRIFDMLEYAKVWLRLNYDRRAVTALEYGLIAAVIIAVAATAFVSLGNQLTNSLGNVQTSLQH
jgi:Flp pilus assembly pilin Flp